MEEKLREHLLELEETLLKPEVRASKQELSKLLADDFFEIGSSGKVLYKDQNIGDKGISIVNMQIDDFDIHELSEEIMLTTYRVYDQENNHSSLRSSIWKYKNGKWKMHFHQGTKTSDPKVW